MDVEEQLTTGMRERVVALSLTTDVVGEAARRHRGRAAVLRLGYAVGAVGLAGALATGMAIGGSDSGSPPTTHALAAPEVRLASAIAATEKISYQVKVTELYRGQRGSEAKPSITEGAFDPATKSGYLQSRWTGAEESIYYQRLVDGVLYISSSGSKDKWKQETGTHDRLRYESNAGGAVSEAVSASADPESSSTRSVSPAPRSPRRVPGCTTSS
jgi:hypothetical protein